MLLQLRRRRIHFIENSKLFTLSLELLVSVISEGREEDSVRIYPSEIAFCAVVSELLNLACLVVCNIDLGMIAVCLVVCASDKKCHIFAIRRELSGMRQKQVCKVFICILFHSFLLHYALMYL